MSNLLARLSVFRNDFSDMIEVSPTGRKEDGRPILERRNIKTAFTQGAEVEIRYTIADLMVILSHTFLDTGDDEGDILSYNPKYSTSLRLGYDVKKTGSSLHLYAQDVRERYYKDAKKGKQELEDYILLNLNLTQKIAKNVRLFFRVTNTLDEEFTLFEGKPQTASLGRTFTGGIRADF